jgi:hypothetical protein
MMRTARSSLAFIAEQQAAQRAERRTGDRNLAASPYPITVANDYEMQALCAAIAEVAQ